MSSLVLGRRLLMDARASWGPLCLLFLLTLAATPLALLTPYPLKLAVDDGEHSLLLATGLTLGVLILQALQGYAAWLYQLYIGEKLVLTHRAEVFQHVLGLSLEHSPADLQYRLQSDVYNMHFLAVYGVLPFLGSVTTFLALLLVTFRFDAELALLGVLAVPLLWLIGRLQAGRSRRLWARHKETEQASLAVLQEALGNVGVVKAFATEEREARRYFGSASVSLGRHMAALWLDSFFGLLVSGVVALASAGALYVGVRHVQAGLLSWGSLLMVMAYLGQLFKPLESMGKQVASMQAALASAERVYQLLDEPADLVESLAPVALVSPLECIEFHEVAFSYGEHRVLEGVSFVVLAGERVGLVGPTGSGKTTLIHLLTRLRDPVAGRITVDGVDLRQLALGDVRRLFSFVPQEPVLFSGTIADNIAYGLPAATKAEIREAACAARADGFIEGLRLGYQTVLGERGAGLSGGERQRISIARAFLRDAPILVMDEPTSSVDSETTADLVESLERLQRGRTVLTITHDGSILQNYDRILRIEGGSVLATRWLTPPVVELEEGERRKRPRSRVC